MNFPGRAAAALLLGVVACARGTPTPPPAAGAPPELASSLNVRVSGDTAQFALHIMNATGGPVTLEFPSGQRYDFTVHDRSGEALWTWSAARSFMQALGEETLAAGEARVYEASWVAPGAGAYSVRATVTATNYPVELQAQFRVE